MLTVLGRVHVSSDWKTEVIVVDNASTDDTAQVVQGAGLRNMIVKYVFESRAGKSHALNAGLAQARGDIILFTDDDVFVAEDWVEQLASPLLSGEFDAVTGQTTLSSHLMRSWLTPMQRWWLASSNDAQPWNGVRELIGANMAFRRSVLEKVRGFDSELGPGALGLGEDTLFGWQLVEAGLKVGYAPQAKAVHQLDSSRLQRVKWLSEARKHGRTDAYLCYHWEHTDMRSPRIKAMLYGAKLSLRRLLQSPPSLNQEGCPPWEMSYVLQIEKCRQFCLERKRPRNYRRRGLTKCGN